MRSQSMWSRSMWSRSIWSFKFSMKKLLLLKIILQHDISFVVVFWYIIMAYYYGILLSYIIIIYIVYYYRTLLWYITIIAHYYGTLLWHKYKYFETDWSTVDSKCRLNLLLKVPSNKNSRAPFDWDPCMHCFCAADFADDCFFASVEQCESVEQLTSWVTNCWSNLAPGRVHQWHIYSNYSWIYWTLMTLSLLLIQKKNYREVSSEFTSGVYIFPVTFSVVLEKDANRAPERVRLSASEPIDHSCWLRVVTLALSAIVCLGKIKTIIWLENRHETGRYYFDFLLHSSCGQQQPEICSTI